MFTIHPHVLCIWCSKYQLILSPCTGHLFTPRSASELTDMLGLQVSNLTFIFINDFGTASQLDFISFYPHLQEGHWSDARLFNVVTKHVNMSVHAMVHIDVETSRLAFQRLQRLRPKGWGTVNVEGGWRHFVARISCVFCRLGHRQKRRFVWDWNMNWSWLLQWPAASSYHNGGSRHVRIKKNVSRKRRCFFCLWCHSMKASAWFRHVHPIVARCYESGTWRNRRRR